KLTPAQFTERILAWGGDPERFARMTALAQSRVERLSDLGPLLAFFFAGRLALSEAQLLEGQKFNKDELRQAIALAMWDLDEAQTFDKAVVEAVLKSVADRMGRKIRDLSRVFYVVLT